MGTLLEDVPLSAKGIAETQPEVTLPEDDAHTRHANMPLQIHEWRPLPASLATLHEDTPTGDEVDDHAAPGRDDCLGDGSQEAPPTELDESETGDSPPTAATEPDPTPHKF